MAYLLDDRQRSQPIPQNGYLWEGGEARILVEKSRSGERVYFLERLREAHLTLNGQRLNERTPLQDGDQIGLAEERVFRFFRGDFHWGLLQEMAQLTLSPATDYSSLLWKICQALNAAKGLLVLGSRENETATLTAGYRWSLSEFREETGCAAAQRVYRPDLLVIPLPLENAEGWLACRPQSAFAGPDFSLSAVIAGQLRSAWNSRLTLVGLQRRQARLRLENALLRYRPLQERLPALASSDASLLLLDRGEGMQEVVLTEIGRLAAAEKGETPRPVSYSLRGKDRSCILLDLFGCVAQWVTGAQAQEGLLQHSPGGILLIDPLEAAWDELLRRFSLLVQEQHFCPLGATQARQAQARLIFCAQRLPAENDADPFYDSLWKPLSAHLLHLPTLVELIREHAFDAGEEIRQQWQLSHGIPLEITPAANELLGRYPWPRGLAELDELISHWEATGKSLNCIGIDQLPERFRRTAPLKLSLEDVEREHIAKILRQLHWHRSQAAELLKISRVTLNQKIKKYGLGPNEET